MKPNFTLLGFITLTAITTACTPPQRQIQRTPTSHSTQVTPRHHPPPSQYQHYSSHPNYSPAIQTRQSIVKLAHQTLGTRYKYGGSNPREGFDCSGLMTYLHKNGAGINIPRTAAQQQQKSQTLRYKEIQAGDLLFFKTSSKSNHVGVYIGNRQFIHAPNRRSNVKITTMDNAYWHSKFVQFGTFLK
jgi:cell wall-associated NlpC family hydrolase